MNILIENEETVEYLTAAGRWSKNPKEGKCFRATESALQAAKHEAVGRFTIVGYFPDTHQFVNLNRGRGQGAVVAA